MVPSRMSRCLADSTIGFIGLGRMGLGMAMNLHRHLPASSTLLIHDVSPTALAAFHKSIRTTSLSDDPRGDGNGKEARGMVKVREGTVEQVREESDVIISMVPSTSHIESLFLSPYLPLSSSSSSSSSASHQPPRIAELGEKRKGKKERIVIDCSTVDPDTSILIRQTYAKLGMGLFVDAPVSGGVKGAMNGTLSFMLGLPPPSPLSSHDATSTPATSSELPNVIEPEVLESEVLGSEVSDETRERITRILSSMGSTTHFCGPPGSGLLAKLTNNYLLSLTNLATAESMHFGTRLSLAPRVLGAVINSGTGRCWPSVVNNPVEGISPGAPVERGYEGGFSLDLMIKDLKLVIDVAKRRGVEVPGAEGALARYEEVRADERYAGKDFGVVYQYLKDKSEGKMK